jgi:hypothetical protein
MRARLSPHRVLLPHTCTQDGWFLQPKRRQSRLRPLSSCLISAKLRSTDSVNPRAVLSRALPRYRLYSKHRDRRCWTGPGIGIRVSFRTYENRRSFRNWNRRLRAGSRPSHLNVVLSKAALSGASVCLRARAPYPLRASCIGADHAESHVLLRSVRLQRIMQALALAFRCIILPDHVGVQQGLQACVPVAPWFKTSRFPRRTVPSNCISR